MKPSKPKIEKGWFVVNQNGEPIATFYYQRRWAVEDCKKDKWLYKTCRIIPYKIIPLRGNHARNRGKKIKKASV